MLTLSDFYIYTDHSDKVAQVLEKLCVKHAAQPNQYAFNWNKYSDEDGTYMEFSRFAINPKNEQHFLADLTVVCDKVTTESGYGWETEAMAA